MIGVDTSSIVACLKGDDASDVDLVTQALQSETLIVTPFVVTELFSERGISNTVKKTIVELRRSRMAFGSAPAAHALSYWKKAARRGRWLP